MKREGYGERAGRDEPLQFAEAPSAADEVDALVASLIGDGENRLEDVLGEQRYRQTSDWVFTLRAFRSDLGLEGETIPAPREDHAEFVGASRIEQAGRSARLRTGVRFPSKPARR